MTTETQQSSVTQCLNLLKRLRKVEETAHKGNFIVPKFQQAHIKIYDILIEIIPLTKHYNQELTDKLHFQKRNFQQQYGMHA